MNRTLKRLSGVACLIASCALVTSCSAEKAPDSQPKVVEYGADYPSYSTLSDLCKAATVVVRGQETSSEVRRVDTSLEPGDTEASNPQLNAPTPSPDPENSLVMTVSQFQVKDVFKGENVKTGETIEVAQMGGILGEISYVAESYPLKGGERVLFLSVIKGTPAFLLNPWQGGYGVNVDGSLIADPQQGLGKSLVEGKRADAQICS